MELFRISINTYAKALTASGSANRWNKSGELVLYAGSTRSLSSLELVVHRAAIKPLANYKVMVISVADEDPLFRQVRLSELPSNWRTMAAYPTLQELGSEWYQRKGSLLLKVPSAIITQEYNYLINTGHPDFAKVSLLRTEDYFWDARLFPVIV
jgi:RES domain-containing protein